MLRIEKVVTHYGQVEALHEVSVHVEEGETLALLGSNGAGKTTLLRTITGLNRVSSGRILFRDQDISNMRPHSITSLGIAMAPEGRQVYPAFTVRENLEVGAYAVKDSKLKAQLLEQVLAEFPRLQERVKQPAGTLSGGEQQMLTIGRAMMSNPSILMLDEPSLGLAPRIVETIFKILARFKEMGRTILLVEQNARAALILASRGYILETGSIELEGPAEDLLHNDEVKVKYLGG
jgi:branched-chain amino acid transport system ATP-binding protein